MEATENKCNHHSTIELHSIGRYPREQEIMSTKKKKKSSLGNLKVYRQAQRIYILELVSEVLEPLAGLISESLTFHDARS